MAMAMRMAGGNNQMDQYTSVRYQNAISSPSISVRCTSLTSLMETVSSKDLRDLYGQLLDDVFGLRTGLDWGLLSLDPSADQDSYCALKIFLSVEGPVMKLIYKLLDDTQAYYPFPIAYLPPSSRSFLQKGAIPPFYANRIQTGAEGAVSANLKLNTFEFYLFHFAYFIVNPAFKGTRTSVNQTETVYTILLEEYLKHYLPTDGSPAPVQSPSTRLLSTNQSFLNSPIQRNTGWNAGRNSQLNDSSYLNNSSSFCNQSALEQQRQRASLLASLLKPGALEMIDSIPTFSNQGVSPLGSSKSETWLSEEFLAIFSEMYLNQSSVKQIQSIAGILQERFVPSHFHVYMVRVLIKHVHFFANSFIASMPILNGSPYSFDLLGELKSIALPRLIQKNLYNFLKLTFDRWPLDDSFRVPLETWLSYIQPWRYTFPRNHKEEEERGFVNRWQKFVTENLHFYTSFLSQALSRISRMDLECPKTAYMLFRVTKVISQDSFDALILKAEKHHYDAHARSPYSPNSLQHSYNQSSYFTESSFLGHQESQSLGLPGPELFSRSLTAQVSRLVSEVKATRDKAASMKLGGGDGGEGFFSNLLSIVNFGDESATVPPEEYSPPDAKKLIFHLDTSIQNLCKLFKLTPPAQSEVQPNPDNSQQQGLFGWSNLSPLKRIRPLDGKMRDKIEYQGNPDLQPVRTYEYEIFVKMFADLSNYLNNKYTEKIEELYFRPSVVGRMCQQLITAPTDHNKVVKYKDMRAPSVEKVHLPPRICLRPLANKHIVWYIFLYLVIMYLMGFHPLPSLVIMMGLIVLFLFLKSFFVKTPVKVD